jgi:hypothetical protein
LLVLDVGKAELLDWGRAETGDCGSGDPNTNSEKRGVPLIHRIDASRELLPQICVVSEKDSEGVIQMCLDNKAQLYCFESIMNKFFSGNRNGGPRNSSSKTKI